MIGGTYIPSKLGKYETKTWFRKSEILQQYTLDVENQIHQLQTLFLSMIKDVLSSKACISEGKVYKM